MADGKRPSQKVMVPALLAVGALVAACVAVPVAAQHVTDVTWLPWAFAALGVAGLVVGIFETNPKNDGNLRNWRSNAVVVFFGPTGSRFVMAVLGAAFLGAGIGLFAGS